MFYSLTRIHSHSRHFVTFVGSQLISLAMLFSVYRARTVLQNWCRAGGVSLNFYSRAVCCRAAISLLAKPHRSCFLQREALSSRHFQLETRRIRALRAETRERGASDSAMEWKRTSFAQSAESEKKKRKSNADQRTARQAMRE